MGDRGRHAERALPARRRTRAASTSPSTRACAYVAQLETALCRAGSGWACNELGNARASRGGDAIGALASWQRGCEMGFEPACLNAGDGRARSGEPGAGDYPILIRGSKAPIVDLPMSVIHARACRQQWHGACEQGRRP